MGIDKTSIPLLRHLDMALPLIGVYDAPEDTDFGVVFSPPQGKHSCFFSSYKKWVQGKTLRLSAGHYGCGGCATWMFDKQNRSRQEYIEFLVDDEGLKARHEDMGTWFDHAPRYRPEYGSLFIGPLRQEHGKYLKTVTFFVNPDQLSVLMIGAQYYHRPGMPDPVIAPFGSGCGQILSLFADLSIPQAIIGATDMAMRKYLPADVLAFTVTVPMFEQLSDINENSFLDKPFIQGLKKARKGKL